MSDRPSGQPPHRPRPAGDLPAYAARINAEASEAPRPRNKPLLEGPTCPSCARTLPAGARVCTDCGVDLRTGRPVLTARAIDENALYVRAENTVRLVSWLVPWGLYPIASEAFGTRRPVVTWVLVLATVLASAAYLGGWASDEAAARRFELWVNRPTSAQIEQAYARPAPEAAPNPFQSLLGSDGGVMESARVAYERQKQVLRRKMPEAELPRAAYDAIPEDAQAYGRFRPAQLVTHAFLHAGLLHLAGNVLFLLVFGSRVNALLGQLMMMLLVYPLLAATGAGAFAWAVRGGSAVSMVGASGAVMGLAGMYLVLFPAHRVHNAVWYRSGFARRFELHLNLFAVRGFWIVLACLALDAALTLLNFDAGPLRWAYLAAHLGGFVGGMLLALILLVSRLVNARGGDLLSVTLGKRAWSLVGKPGTLR